MISEEKKDQIVRMYKDGMKLSDIQKELDVKEGLINKTLKERNIPRTRCVRYLPKREPGSDF